MKRRLLALSAGLLLAGGLAPAPAPVAASFNLDQHCEGGIFDWWMSNAYVAQTFTTGINGMFRGVDLVVYSTNTPTHVDMYIDALDADGHPTGSHISQALGITTTTQGWVSFSPQPFMVTVGQRLAIVIHAWTTDFHVKGYYGTNPYPGGMTLHNYGGSQGWKPLQDVTTSDFNFRTWVQPVINIPVTPATQPARGPTPTPAATKTANATERLAATDSAAPTDELASSTQAADATPPGAESSGTEAIILPAALIVLAIVLPVLVLVGIVLFLLLRRRRRTAS